MFLVLKFEVFFSIILFVQQWKIMWKETSNLQKEIRHLTGRQKKSKLESIWRCLDIIRWEEMLEMFSEEVFIPSHFLCFSNMSRCSSYVALLLIGYPGSCIHSWLAYKVWEGATPSYLWPCTALCFLSWHSLAEWFLFVLFLFSPRSLHFLSF